MAIVGPDGRLLRVNRALCTVTGHQPAELEGRSMLSLLHPDDRPAARSRRPSACSPGRSRPRAGSAATCTTTATSSGSRWSTTLVRDAGSGPMHFLTQAHDVTERRRYEAELRHMADHDALTGLLNRRAFERELEPATSTTSPATARAAPPLLIDVDLFKNVNDTLGHSAGDQLIGKVADALRERLRDGEVIARLGGDEFAVLVPDGDAADAEHVAGRAARLDPLRAHLQPLGPPADDQRLIGVAPFDSRRLTGEDVLVNADLAMYEAKEAGRDQVACHVGTKESRAGSPRGCPGPT